MLHMHPDLVRTAGFKFTFNQRHIFESFEYRIMSNGFFSVFSIGVDIHYFSETLMPAYMTANSTRIFFKITPYQCMVSSFNSMIKKLVTQVQAGFVVFSHKQ